MSRPFLICKVQWLVLYCPATDFHEADLAAYLEERRRALEDGDSRVRAERAPRGQSRRLI